MGFAPLTALPKGALTLLREMGRHLLRRPVVGIAAIARDGRGHLLLVRRADNGQWALPGGTLEWGETLRSSIVRELFEEAGVEQVSLGPVVGVFSRPDRDPRFHGVTVAVRCTVGAAGAPGNPLEIREVRFFAPEEVPASLAFGMEDMVAAELALGSGAGAVFE
jgi:8-oxo-dGTP diphosphatase